MSKPFEFAGEYKKTRMNPSEGKIVNVESNWNDAAKKNGMLRFIVGNEKFVIRAVDLISNMMAHAGEESARYMSDGLMHKTKKKYSIDYDFFVRLQRTHFSGEMLNCTIKIEVPEELMDVKGVVRKHIAREGQSHGIPIIGAPVNAGQLPKGSPKLSK